MKSKSILYIVLLSFFLLFVGQQSFSQAYNAELSQKLEALEAAREAGILTHDEFKQKEQILRKRYSKPQLSVSQQKKLQALEAAKNAGVISHQEYIQKKSAMFPDLSPSTTPTPAPKVTAEYTPPSKKARKTFMHPIGFTFVYPADWVAQNQPNMILLTPPNQKKSAYGPDEVYFIAGESVAGEGIYDPSDPRVIQYLDNNVRQLAPFLQLKSGSEKINLKTGKGVILNWSGTNYSGVPVIARAYVAIINTSGVGLYSLGKKEYLQKRFPELKEIFTSFGFQAQQLDQRLTGNWQLTSTTSIRNNSPFETSWSRAQAVSDTQISLQLFADGTWKRTTNSHTLAGASGIWLESKDNKTENGTWCAGSGELHLISKGDLWESYQYRLEGQKLRLVSGNQGEIWTRN